MSLTNKKLCLSSVHIDKFTRQKEEEIESFEKKYSSIIQIITTIFNTKYKYLSIKGSDEEAILSIVKYTTEYLEENEDEILEENYAKILDLAESYVLLFYFRLLQCRKEYTNASKRYDISLKEMGYTKKGDYFTKQI